MTENVSVKAADGLQCVYNAPPNGTAYVRIGNHCNVPMVAILQWSGANNQREEVRVDPASIVDVKIKSNDMNIVGERPG